MFEDNFENRFRSNGRTLITRSILGCGTMEMGGMSLEIFAKYGKFGGITGEKTRGKKKGREEKTVCLRRSQFFNTVSGKYRLSIFSFLVSFQSATRIPFRRIDSTQRVALCILSILLFRIE